MKKLLFVSTLLLVFTYSFAQMTCTAVMAGGNFQTDETWEVSDWTMCTEYIIPSGVTVTVSPNLTLDNKTIIVSGTLVIAADVTLNLGQTSALAMQSGGMLSAGNDNSTITSTDGSTPLTYSGQTAFDDIEDNYLSGGTLPIELTTFTGKRVGSTIRLAWETASEEQNDYMEVQRSKNGKRSFERLGTIESKAGAAGTSQQPLQYAFIDEQPLPGVNYYRLMQVDLDGKYEYHKTIAVLFETDGKQQDITVFPSVTPDRVNIALANEATADGELFITNLAGQVVLRTPFERGMQQENIDVTQLPQGHYLIRVQTGREVFTARFVKR